MKQHDLPEELQRHFKPRDQAPAAMRKDMRALMERSSRPPGSTAEPQPFEPRKASLVMTVGDSLRENTRFSEWLKEPKSHQSHLELGMRFEVKTGPVPISGVGVPTPYMLPRLGSPLPALRLGQVLPRMPIDAGSAVTFTQETSFTPSAAIVPETTLKPPSGLTFTNVTVPFATLATFVKASLQAIRDLPMLTPWIENRLSYAVLLKEEQHLLLDANGLLAQASPVDPTYAPGAGATQLDQIGAAISQLEAQGYDVDAVVMNGSDISKTRLLKSTIGDYIWSDPDSETGTSAVWSVPLVRSISMPSNQFLVGAFGQSTLLFQRDILTVMIAFQNEDDFIKNLATFRAEERVALSVLLPGGLLRGTFSAAAAESAHAAPPVKK